MLWGNTAYCVKLSDEDVTRYSNETEPVLFYENVAWYYHCLANQVMQQ